MNNSLLSVIRKLHRFYLTHLVFIDVNNNIRYMLLHGFVALT